MACVHAQGSTVERVRGASRKAADGRCAQQREALRVRRCPDLGHVHAQVATPSRHSNVKAHLRKGRAVGRALVREVRAGDGVGLLRGEAVLVTVRAVGDLAELDQFGVHALQLGVGGDELVVDRHGRVPSLRLSHALSGCEELRVFGHQPRKRPVIAQLLGDVVHRVAVGHDALEAVDALT
eukprot:scaffold66073_cov75-Phaeocystis_antarctica.AAC.2